MSGMDGKKTHTHTQCLEALHKKMIMIGYYKGSGRGSLSPPPSSVVGNALVVIDDGIESVNVKNRYQGARVSVRRESCEPEDGIRWKFVHGRAVLVR